MSLTSFLSLFCLLIEVDKEFPVVMEIREIQQLNILILQLNTMNGIFVAAADVDNKHYQHQHQHHIASLFLFPDWDGIAPHCNMRNAGW